ncbi:MAG: DNA-binding response regulator [Flavobacteriales bacterium]|nr:DNA-binding response regulator [Flavobacteriales bacterium]|tara:strand:+ start:1731 stop:2420 length:690 start_codon:yes stop_codon:yes gene_type:complete
MDNKKHILIVEDEVELALSTIHFLQDNHFTCTHTSTIQSALKEIKNNHFHAALLDLGLPDGDGLVLIKELKNKNQETGVIIVSAKDTLNKKIDALELGADDYLTKPFFFAELNARIKSLIRRLNVEESKKIVINELSIYPEEMKVVVHDKVADLTSKEFSLLLYFASNQNRVLSKTILGEFMSSGYDDYGFSDDLVYTHIKNLKKKLSKLGCTEYIKNVYGIGYKFITN